MRLLVLLFFLFCLRLNAMVVTSQPDSVSTNAPPIGYEFTDIWPIGDPNPKIPFFDNGSAASAWPLTSIATNGLVTAVHVVGDLIGDVVDIFGVDSGAIDGNGVRFYRGGNQNDTIVFNMSNNIPFHVKVFTNFVTSADASGVDFRYTNTPSLSTAEFMILAKKTTTDTFYRWAYFQGVVMAAVSSQVYVYPKQTYESGDPGFTVEAGDSGGPVFIRTMHGWQYFAHIWAATGGAGGGIFQALWTGQEVNSTNIANVVNFVDFDGSGNALYSGGGGSPPNLPERKISFRVRR